MKKLSLREILFYYDRKLSAFFSMALCLSLTVSVGVAVLPGGYLSAELLKDNSRQDSDFIVTPELASHVEFWKLVFTRYGRNHLIFHHRERPEIVYAVFDFSKYASGDDSLLKRKQNEVTKAETDRIRNELLFLARGGVPSTPFQERLVKLFAHIRDRGKYASAADDNVIRVQSGMKERFAESIARAPRYLNAIEQIFAENGLPLELARIPFVESSFNYNAVSSVGASGIWQFMRSTGKGYMRIDANIDERRDPIISSRAAAQYLKRAHEKLGNWQLAVTSYNHGVAGISRAVSQVGSHRLIDLINYYESPSFGFASKSFFVSFLAALEVSRNHRKYFPGLVLEEPIRFDELRIAKPVTYESLRSFSGLSEDEFRNLNASFLAPIVNGKKSIPAGALVKVASGRGSLVTARLGGYSVELAGDVVLASNKQEDGYPEARISSISKSEKPKNSAADDLAKTRAQFDSKDRTGKYELTNDDKQLLNALENSGRSMGSGKSGKGVSSAVAGVSETRIASAKKNTKASSVAEYRHYIVKKGDSLEKIASTSGLKVSELKKLNPDATRVIKPGDKIKLR